MNIILLSADEVRDQTATLADRRATHIVEVLKLHVGDSFRIGLLGGETGVGIVTEIDGASEQPKVSLTTRWTDAPPPPSRVQLVLALPRPKALRRILETVTEMGVKKIVLLNAAKVEKSYWEAHQLRTDQLQSYLTSGLELSADTILPEVQLAPRFRPFVEDTLPTLADGTEKWVAHPYAQSVYSPPPSTKAITLCVGPEGGWVDFELELLKAQGFQLGRLGERILSSETAVPALLSCSV